jgi:serine/threonine protein kinase
VQAAAYLDAPILRRIAGNRLTARFLRPTMGRFPPMLPTAESLELGVKAGDVLAGKYRIDRVLGAGGMGAVVEAHHIQLEDKVALKFLLPEALSRPEAVTRFLREARAAVRIKSEHVARVTDVGQLENGAPYMVMEYLEGGDLEAMLARGGPLPPEQAVDFVLQASEAIAEAHTLGIVHRDLKPANLYCIRRADGHLSIKVLDFGISKVTTPGSQHNMTQTAAMIGSPVYMSPEQMQSAKDVDARTDIWATGAILFELISGRTPFWSESITDLAVKVVNDPAPPLAELVPTVPAGLAQVVATCLEKARERRYQNMGDLAVALAPFGSKRARVSVDRILDTLRAAGISQAVLPPSGPPPPIRIGHDTAASWDSTDSASKPRSGGLLLVAIAGVLALVGAAAVLVLRHPSSPATGASGASATPAAPTTSATASAPPPVPALPTLSPPEETTPASPPASGAPAATAPAQPVPPRWGRLPAAPGPKTPSKASCNPPYTVDPATGEHRYKPECL